MFQTINPTNNQVIASFSALSGVAVQEKLESSGKAFQNYWRKISVAERSNWIYKIGEHLRQNTRRYAELITLEMGKPIRQSVAEIEKCAWLCDYFAEHAVDFLKNKSISTEFQKSYIRYDPLGAILGIMPWNFPFWQTFRFGIPALLAGNVILLKPAPNVPQCGLSIEKMFLEIIGKAGIFQTLLVEVKEVAELLAHPLVQGVSLTGSDRAGASVAALAGSHIKKCVLELGGSDAFIVLDDAHLERAARIGVQSRMNNSGQTCIAAKRFIVHEKVAPTFIELLKNEVARLKIGDPMQEDTDISALARLDLCEKLEQQVQQSIAKGATMLLKGGKRNGTGNFFQPIILTSIQSDMPAYSEEFFGPVILLFIVKNDEEAIALANDSAYGLGAAIWSQHIERAEAIAHRLEVGAIFINDFVKSDPRLPFGGIKRSGYGRELAEEGIKEFVNVKTIVVQ